MNDQIKKYIVDGQAAGLTTHQMKAELIGSGWNKYRVAFYLARPFMRVLVMVLMILACAALVAAITIIILLARKHAAGGACQNLSNDQCRKKSFCVSNIYIDSQCYPNGTCDFGGPMVHRCDQKYPGVKGDALYLRDIYGKIIAP